MASRVRTASCIASGTQFDRPERARKECAKHVFPLMLVAPDLGTQPDGHERAQRVTVLHGICCLLPCGLCAQCPKVQAKFRQRPTSSCSYKMPIALYQLSCPAYYGCGKPGKSTPVDVVTSSGVDHPSL